MKSLTGSPQTVRWDREPLSQSYVNATHAAQRAVLGLDEQLELLIEEMVCMRVRIPLDCS